MKRRNNGWRVIRAVLIGPALLLIIGLVAGFVGLQVTALPPAINMSSTGDMGDMGNMGGMLMPLSQPTPPGAATPIASLAGPLTATHTSRFTLTAEPAQLTLGPGAVVDAWTYNGTAPGPTLRVRQGDLVVVTLINHLPVGVTIHWHGVAVPNAEDGVAGLTQDAVKPGESYTYRFIAKDAGTYWYHSHQQSLDETSRGLYGMFIVDPAVSTEHDDVDVAVALHGWALGGQSSGPFGSKTLTVNDTTGTLRITAAPGQWVRLRVANTTGNDKLLVTLLGAPFTILALDGHDLNGPTPLSDVLLPVGEGQRYDIRFRMPDSGPVSLVTANSDGKYQASPGVVVGSWRDSPIQGGQGGLPNPLPASNAQRFDLATYGSPLSAGNPDAISQQSHFDVTYTMTLGSYVGFWAGRLGQVWTLNGQAFPNTPAYVVESGQLVKIHMVNTSSDVHTMHLHGHSFAVLTRNGLPLADSPVYLDTLLIGPKETYDIAFHANNPGLWMFHCHNLVHANWGMDMMLVYPNISTPYLIGPQSGNLPD
jgi:FtsP/CotA-like multicopper oxidase with cupredoxin domain